MSSFKRFKVKKPDVIHEIIDGEAVIVNMTNGKYYSTDKSGAFIWSLIDKGLPVNQMIHTVANQYHTGNVELIEKGVEQIIEQLLKENLIIPALSENASPPANLNLEVHPREKLPFEEPVLHHYTDMEDLLLLDPIHEVDDQGWPDQPSKTDK